MSTKKALNLSWYQRFTYSVVNFSEYFFYNLGYKVGLHPKKTILFCWCFVFLSGLGFLRFYQEKNPVKLWVPPNTKFVKDTEWLMEKFQRGYRPEIVLIEADNVLTPQILQNLLEIDQGVKHVQTSKNITWDEICFRIPKMDNGLIRLLEGDRKESNVTEKDPVTTMNAALYCSFVETMEEECFEKSILELWNYDASVISKLTQDDVIHAINSYDKNAALWPLKDYEKLLGAIERNATGHIVGAKTLHNFWMAFVNFTLVDMDKTGNSAGTSDWVSEEGYEWEQEFLTYFENLKTDNLTFYYSSGRSFADLSNASMFQDLDKLSIGVFLVALYVQFVISKWNWLEARITLGCVGLLTVGMSYIVGCGLSSLFGVSYGPVHASLPFLLMGLGVDDIFVIMACWEDLSVDQKKLPMPERIGLMLKHGGVSITITSLTDVIAFLIGSSTILPSLESFCIYAGICVFVIYIFILTFFVACFVLDQKRIEDKRNGIIVCYTHANYEVNDCSQRQISNNVFRQVYSKVILTPVGKIVVILITVICLGFSLESIVKLQQRFEPEWFLPESSYLANYLKIRKTYYPTSGFDAGIFLGAVNYTHELKYIKEMNDNLFNEREIVLDVMSWVEPFRNFVNVNFQTDIYSETLSEERFSLYLSMFLFTPRNAIFQANFRFADPLKCGVPASKIIMSSFDFHFNYFSGPEQYLPAMHRIQDIAEKTNFTTGDKFATSWAQVYYTWITDELIDVEVLRNLQLALICVMICTAILIADFQTCFWIFLCVLFTMVNVCGFMQRWGITIDVATCIGLELAIGLCVDYAAHIGHTFLTIQEGTRMERSLKTVATIGSAVVYGGVSVLIAVLMLAVSEAYIFKSFFKIFVLVIVFGLFHGVVFLPVILSWVGPKPYNTHKIVEQDETEMTNK